MMRNIRLIFEYDGTDFCGWQKQPKQDVRTVQSELELAVSTLLSEPIEVTVAGRTDTGVHAYGQVVNFETTSTMPLKRIPYSLNAILPDDIAVKDAKEVPEEFDARHNASWREYNYYILNRSNRSVFLQKFTHHEGRWLDVESMDKGVKFLLGRHDFLSFYTPPRNEANRADTTERTVLDIGCIKSKDIVWCGEPVEGLISLRIKAHAFLHNMVRIIAGTAIEIGLGILEPEDMVDILQAKDRTHAGHTAPARGLTLVRVAY